MMFKNNRNISESSFYAKLNITFNEIEEKISEFQKDLQIWRIEKNTRGKKLNQLGC